MSPAIAPYSASYLNRVPYLTVTEFKNAPTALDLSNFIPAGSSLSQDEALFEMIGRASSVADAYCFGESGTLCASSNVENRRIRSNRDGEYQVWTKYWPILSVDAFSVGPTPADLQALSIDNTTCWIEEQMFTVVASGFSQMTNKGPLQFGIGALGRRQFAQWTYTNGWPNTLLAGAVTVGASSALLKTADGIFPGTTLTFYDAPNDEALVVSPTYVPGSLTVTFTSTFASAHAIGVSVSALPPVIKQAAIAITSALIKARGDEAIVLAAMTEGSTAQSGGGAKPADDKTVRDLIGAANILDRFKAVI